MASQLVRTATNMVGIVNNIIQGYQMGAIRALAQEPVQNSLDAARVRGRCQVEFRLHDRTPAEGSPSILLTVTDSGTTGLLGQPRQISDIETEEGLEDGENWAAFEGMGFTKKAGADSLGSRGQGKAAFLYHAGLDMILYDTLLESGEYRLGARHARPSDTVLSPPHEGNQARRTVTTAYVHPSSGQEVALGLEPLGEPGTRIIVPSLSDEAVGAFRSGELYQWLQRCWWRAIQEGLSIRLVDEVGMEQLVEVPQWWRDEPWRAPHSKMHSRENIRVDSDLQIKRLVLFYDETLTEPDIEDISPQFQGVQLLRSQQWIETLSFTEAIPRDNREGFRGFVEFDNRTESILRQAESPQHDRFDRRYQGVKSLQNWIDQEVRRFAENMDWISPQQIRATPDQERDAAYQFMRFFNPRTRRHMPMGSDGIQPSLWDNTPETLPRWTCDLRLAFPSRQKPRVDWGQSLTGVSVDVGLSPARDTTPPTVRLLLSADRARSPQTLLSTISAGMWEGIGNAPFGDYQVIKGRPRGQQICCDAPGKWRLTAEVHHAGAVVARDSRGFYVQEDPLERTRKPFSISISAENQTTRRRRFDNGDLLGLQVKVRNQGETDVEFQVDASLEHELLADKTLVQAPATPPGATTWPVAALHDVLAIQIVGESPPAGPRAVVLSAGRHTIRADLRLGGEVVANASKTIDVGIDPVRNDDWPPFRVEQRSDGVYPRYELLEDGDGATLYYPSKYPLYVLLSRLVGGGDGASAFVVDACAEGLVEWSLYGASSGDDSRLDEILNWELPEGVDESRWEQFGEKLRDLSNMTRNPEDWATLGIRHRECAALLLAMYGGKRDAN